jgi:hypothetical protein
MPRKPNYAFERHERDRAKAVKLAQKADAKREERERRRALSDDTAGDDTGPGSEPDGGSEATSVPDEA